MTREEAIEVYNGLINVKIREAFEFFAPELAESEDERTRKHIIEILESLSPCHWNGNEKSKCIAYLEKQKEQKHEPCDLQKAFEDGQESIVTEPEKYGLQKPAEWSEEDENMMNNIIRVLSTFVGTVECESNPSLSSSYPTYLREIDWLKSLKNRGNFPKSNTNSPSEWNDEDDVMLAHIIFLVNGNMGEDETIMWLKERFKNLGARPRWKPSAEQMRQLGYVAEQNKHNMLGKELMTLYNDLKKLI